MTGILSLGEDISEILAAVCKIRNNQLEHSEIFAYHMVVFASSNVDRESYKRHHITDAPLY